MEKPHQLAVCWFRRGLRLDDNRALLAALNDAHQIIPLFILDPDILARPDTGTARVHFLLETLKELDRALQDRGGRLILRQGRPVEQLERLIEETGATALHFSRDYEPYSRKRDSAVEKAMRQRGVAVHTHSDHLLTEPGEILTQADARPYTVFTPYKRVWTGKAFDSPLPAPRQVPVPMALRSEELPPGNANPGQSPLVRGGETAAWERMDDFLQRRSDGIREYDSQREFPAVEGTSRLSAYLRMGVLSPRRLYAGVVAQRHSATDSRFKGYETFLSELAWRDFYYQILWHFPYVAEGAFKQEYNALNWDNDEALFQAWCQGRTGYPIVDAAMRQLNTEAWMHNRARMIVASFLTKDLLVDWRWGERYFMQKLVDGDLASNNGGWQWAAGTGTDAQPYFRIFNPVSQGEKFDPDGAYVKRWVPELAKVPAKWIHQPWKLSVAEQQTVGAVLGRDYPLPVVEHAAQRERALALYRAAKNEEN